jgi:peptide/nickel transport system permease protein
MLNFILRRLLISVVLLFLISLISFFIITLTPGSPYPWGELNPKITPQVKEAFRKKFHLDRPLYEQYWLNMRDLFGGNLKASGRSAVLGRIAERLPATVSLNVLCNHISLTFGLSLASMPRSAANSRRAPRFSPSFIALPGFWISDWWVSGS